MPGTNTLAYLASSSAMKETSFKTLTPGLVFVSKAGASFCRMSTRRMPSWGSTAEHTGDQLPQRVIINGERQKKFILCSKTFKNIVRIS